mmetsp:Transcript_16557/g.35822  ORF Transcript_16557/g.35822 Transcript_16557/m.35822 type:complete len:154 (-) Transcript_16557:2061-2522(-)
MQHQQHLTPLTHAFSHFCITHYDAALEPSLSVHWLLLSSTCSEWLSYQIINTVSARLSSASHTTLEQLHLKVYTSHHQPSPQSHARFMYESSISAACCTQQTISQGQMKAGQSNMTSSHTALRIHPSYDTSTVMVVKSLLTWAAARCTCKLNT